MIKMIVPVIVVTIACHIFLADGQREYQPPRYQRRFYRRQPARSYERREPSTSYGESGSQRRYQRPQPPLFNPDPDADVYTEQGVPFPGTASQQTRPLRQGSGRVYERRAEPFRRESRRQAPRRYVGQRESYRTYGGRDVQSVSYQPMRRRYASDSTRVSVDRYRHGRQRDSQPAMPRYRDLGIQESPAAYSEYQYANRDPDHVPAASVASETVSTLDMQGYRSQPAPEIRSYVTSRPGDFSQLSLPQDAWKTISVTRTVDATKKAPIAPIVSPPRTSEFVAKSESVKRTRVPASVKKVEPIPDTVAKTKVSKPKPSTQSKPIVQPIKTAVKKDTQPKRVPETTSSKPKIPGLETISIQTVLKSYNLTATGSYFLTPETRQRNLVALQNVVPRRPRRRGSRRTRRF